ncbi:MAG TPA: twin-arginine translocase subunit TatC [Acidimicrobiales bacterium]|nr:twin-arginine translocase subunit TatC [Acidimicrobiales bacterium]
MTVTDDPPGRDRDAGEMTLQEHLAELRKRLGISVGALVVTTLVMWFFYDALIGFMEHPYCDFLRAHPQKSVGTGCQLYITGPVEGFTTRLKVSGYAGVVVASPVILWELWRFITPGLHKNEKRYVVPFVAAGCALFAAGVAVAVAVFPKAIGWLIDVSGKGVVPLLSPSRYFTLYALMAVVFGLVFLFPLVQVFLEIAGVVPSATWRRWRRPAIVVLVVIAAVITPSGDPFSFLAMAVPLVIFYEASIVVGRIMHK